MTRHTILCPVDYSESTEVAVSLAVDLAKSANSRVVLLHVTEPNKPAISLKESADKQFQERLRKQYLDLYEVDYESVTRHGDPAEIVIAYSKQNGVNLIVMGTH